MRSRRVRPAMALATCSEAEITERVGVKWISPSQTQSMPSASARSAVSKMSRNAETCVAPWRISSTKSPTCTACIVEQRRRPSTPRAAPQRVANHHRISTNLSFTHSRLVKVKAGPSVAPGTQPLEPDLAESWSQPNDRTYVFKLRKGVRWHPKPPVNGRELTADDIKYTYDRFLQLKEIGRASCRERV